MADADEMKFGPHARQLIDVADRAAASIAAGQPSKKLFDMWVVIARALLLAQTAISERHGGRCGHLGRPWRVWLARHPGLAALKSSERSHATWLASNEEAVTLWRDGLPPRAQARINHPATARLSYQRHLREQQIVLALKTKRVDERAARVRLEKVIADMAQRFAAMEGEVMTLRGRVASLEAVATGAMIQPEQARRAAKAA